MSAHHHFDSLEVVNTGCRSSEGCPTTKNQFHGMPTVYLSPSDFYVSLLQQCSKCQTAGAVSQIPTECHDSLEHQIRLSDKTELDSTSWKLIECWSWCQGLACVMWYTTVKIMAHNDVSLLLNFQNGAEQRREIGYDVVLQLLRWMLRQISSEVWGKLTGCVCPIQDRPTPTPTPLVCPSAPW